MAAQFLKELPCRNRTNFSHYQVDTGPKSCHKKASAYLPTVDQADSPDQQVITTEKTNILLRYLHQQWDKQNAKRVNAKRRESASDSEACVAKKRVRVRDDDH